MILMHSHCYYIFLTDRQVPLCGSLQLICAFLFQEENNAAEKKADASVVGSGGDAENQAKNGDTRPAVDIKIAPATIEETASTVTDAKEDMVLKEEIEKDDKGTDETGEEEEDEEEEEEEEEEKEPPGQLFSSLALRLVKGCRVRDIQGK